MATIYDKNKDICGIIVKGNASERVESVDSALSGKYNKYINVNVIKANDKYDYYLPLSFNENHFNIVSANKYFNYNIDNYSYNGPSNNYKLYNDEWCWFNNFDFHKWMNDNGKWSTLFSDELVSRGYNYLSSCFGAGGGNSYMCNANKNQEYFIKPSLKHDETSYDVKYNYYNTAYKTNSAAANLYITTRANDTSSTDVTISSKVETNFNLGYNGILSGNGLTNYIESVDTTNTTGRPFWQRFFFVSIKGGYNALNSYNVSSYQKTNTKLCTFDQNTGLENESNSYLNSIPLKYKKLRNDVYYVQDDNFKSFKTYPTLGYSVIKRTSNVGGDIYYYNGSPQSNDMEGQEHWTSLIEEATHFNTEPNWLTVEVKQQYEANHHCSLLFTSGNDEYSVKISLPVVMNTTTATFWMDKLYYITANNEYVYTGTNNVSEYTTGHWTKKIYSFFSADNPSTVFATPETIKFYNRQGESFNHFSPSYLMDINEISYELSDTSKYKWVLYYKSYGGYWVSGLDAQATYSEDLTNNVQVFATSADANVIREQFNSNAPNIIAIDSNKTNKVFFSYEYLSYMQATMFSSWNDANNIINKMYQEDPDDLPPGATSVGVFSAGNMPYYTYYFNNNCPTAGNSYVEIPSVKWLSLNYFFKL